MIIVSSVSCSLSSSGKQDYFDQGVTAYESGDYELAKILFEKADGYSVADAYLEAIEWELTDKKETTEATTSTTMPTSTGTTTISTTLPTSTETTTTSTTSTSDLLSTGQINAVRKAKEYLSIMSFSHDGLIEQLEYEKFTHTEAVYGADNCGANWNEQAVDKAKEYLSIMSFSHDGLIDQLEFDKFTHGEALYGADNCGADWNEQAVSKAKEYLDIMSFSRAGLIEQLEFDQFTHKQAVYGADHCGVTWD